jgi:lipopolysaccharide/colanic/teichoic acid biosynthesis glycosyltransferase
MRAAKRAADVVVSALLLLMLSPAMVVIALAIATVMGSPVLFRQRRSGLQGRQFTMLKFRTMRADTESEGRLLPDALRLTPLGAFLRSTSLDELPQLLNVLKGEMSLVGPRPLMPEYMPYYTQREQLRHTVLPGITGWAQVRGRNQARWDERLAMDVWYVENWSLWLDMRVLALTLMAVLGRTGVVVDPASAMLSLDEERKQWLKRST